MYNTVTRSNIRRDFNMMIKMRYKKCVFLLFASVTDPNCIFIRISRSRALDQGIKLHTRYLRHVSRHQPTLLENGVMRVTGVIALRVEVIYIQTNNC